MNIVVDLPPPLVRDILVEWIDFGAIGALDSAFCNHQLRAAYHRVLSSPDVVFPFKVCTDAANHESICLWLTSRHVKISKIKVAAHCSRDTSRLLAQAAQFLTDFTVRRFRLQKWNCFSKCVNLTRMHFDQCVLDCSIAQFLSTCNHLQELRIDAGEPSILSSSTGSSNADMSLVFQNSQQFTCPSMRRLLLHCKPNDGALEDAASMFPNLQELQLHFSHQITNALGSSLSAHCHALTTLCVEGFFTLGDAFVYSVLQGCPGLTSVNLNKCTGITNVSIQALVRQCKGLTKLCIEEVLGVDDYTIELLAVHKSTLHSLHIAHCTELMDYALTLLCEQLHVYCLTLGDRNDIFTEPAVSRMLSLSAQLQELTLHRQVQSSTLTNIAQCCTTLNKLPLVHQLRPDSMAPGLHALVTQCGSLRTLCLGNAAMINKFSLLLLRTLRPDLSVVLFYPA